MKKYFFISVFLSLFPSVCFANNLTISNVSLEKRRVVNSVPMILVEFDISWDNSWRHSENYDAAWIVFKASLAGSSTLTHCDVVSNSSGYNLGNSTGSNPDLEFVFPSSQDVGVFLQPKASGEGTTATTDARLTVTCGSTTSQSIAIRVIGIEMVYIPQAPFYAGDTTSFAGFVKYSSVTDPWFIESESTILTTNSATGSYYYTSSGGASEFSTGDVFTIPDDFPKGYAPFYCMKYPITEGQWVEFFNYVSSTQQATLDITSSSGGKNSDSVMKRNTISWPGSGSATTSREDRAVSYINWMDVAAYLDWVGLRPMSELEFEKVARGPLQAVPGEYAWGNTIIYAGMTFAGSPEDGNEAFISANIANTAYNATTFSQGDAFLGAQFQQGPVRPGIFAQAETTRERAGAGYYGVMDLSGNLFEQAVSVGTTTGITFYPVHGDGVLVSAGTGVGNARALGWPGTDVDGIDGVSSPFGSGYRGGSWESAWGILRVSDRSDAAFETVRRQRTSGGRGVRSVSPITLPTCGDSVRTHPEQCDDGMHCSITLNSCIGQDDCPNGETCAPVDGDDCSAECECEAFGSAVCYN